MLSSSIVGKVFVVTGSASGIGFETATTLLAQGALLGLCDVNHEGLLKFVSELSEENRNKVVMQAVDVTNRSAVASFLKLTKERFGKIDGIANVAGAAGRKLGHQTIWEIDEDEYNFIMDTNVKGTFNILSEALKPGLLQNSGSIVHVGSMFSERGFSKGSIYSASKHACVCMVKSAAIDAAAKDIRVNLVMPGPIDTPMLRANEESGAEGTESDVPLGRLGEAVEVANVIIFLLSDNAKYVTGATWAVDGGANA
ncbi:oxidoreductase [Cunninghamella echinulata]|nr:oxidoreductase [Cunninghamella echinulata]